VEVSQDVVHLVRERRRNWRSLQVLAGRDVESSTPRITSRWKPEAAAQGRDEARESSIDSIARAMSELAASSKAPPIAASRRAPRPARHAARRRRACGRPAAAGNGALLSYAEEDVAKCSNCKTCYQELPELFEKSQIVVDGEAKEVGHLIAGALAR